MENVDVKPTHVIALPADCFKLGEQFLIFLMIMMLYVYIIYTCIHVYIVYQFICNEKNSCESLLCCFWLPCLPLSIRCRFLFSRVVFYADELAKRLAVEPEEIKVGGVSFVGRDGGLRCAVSKSFFVDVYLLFDTHGVCYCLVFVFVWSFRLFNSWTVPLRQYSSSKFPSFWLGDRAMSSKAGSGLFLCCHLVFV